MIKDYVALLANFARVYSYLFIFNLIVSTIIVFFERKKPVSTLLWVMAINFLPIIGLILYIFIGQDVSKSKMFQKKTITDKDIDRDKDIQLREITEGRYKYANERTAHYDDVIKMFNTSEGELIYSNNDVKVYNNGRDKFEDLFKDIENAKRTLYIQYYIFKSDNLSKKFIDLLIKKAREGLEVYLLVDGMGARKLKFKDRDHLEEAGVNMAIFFPGIFPKINTHINYRNHRKIAVIDKRIAYVGGLNVGDEYLGKGPLGYWRDTHLRIVGDAVNALTWRFYIDFRFASGKDPSGFTTEHFENSGKKDICIVTSGPDTKADSIRNGYEKIITRAKREIYIQTPYFVPDEGLLKCLKVAALSGVDVNIMFPAKKDHPFVHWASLSFVGELLEWGVKVYMYEDGFLHTKVVFCDDYFSSVGTANFDIRSFELNFEVNAFIFDEEINKKLKEDFREDVKKCKEITFEYYKNRRASTKIKESISRLLSPLL